MDDQLENANESALSDTRVLTDAIATTACEKCGCEIDVQEIPSFSEVECPDCSARITVPARLGAFLLLKMLGAGGMGAVYIAKDVALGRQVAVKVMLKSLGDDEQFVQAFKKEAQAAAKINHPNICQIYSFGTEKGQPYIVMELISGERFDRLVESGRKLDQGLVMQVGHDIAQGLAAAYEEELLHGDIKPENILMDEKLRAKLVDFGIASVAGQSSEGIWGTPYYIAPEKLLRQKPDGRSDMYSLGATLYHALAGRPPFEGKTPIDVVKARLDRDPAPIEKIRNDLKPEVASVIARMLQRTPSMRHPTYASLVSDLAKCVSVCGGRKKSLAAIHKTGRIVLTKRSQQVSSQSEGRADAPRSTAPKIIIAKKAVTLRSTTSLPGTPASAPQEEALPAKPRSKAPLVVFLAMLLLAGLSAGGYYAMKRHKEKIALRKELIAFQSSMSEMQVTSEGIASCLNTITKNADAAAAIAVTASNAVKLVTGQELAYGDALSRPAQPEGPSGSDDAGSKNETPAGAQASEPPSETAVKRPRIVELAREVIDGSLRMAEIRSHVSKALDQASEIIERSRNSNSSEKAASGCSEVMDLKNGAQQMEAESKSILASLKKKRDEIETARTEFNRENKEKAEELARAEKAAKAEAEARRKEEQHQAQIAEELTLIDTARQQAIESYKTMNFTGGLAALKEQGRAIRTPEAKKVYNIHIERGQLLVDMHKFLVDQISVDPYPWGWIQGVRAVDVQSATMKDITTRTGTVKWEEVGISQMLHFFKKYMNKQSLPLRTLGRQNLAAAVYCDIHGGKQAAGTYRDTALSHDPALRELAEQLLPENEE